MNKILIAVMLSALTVPSFAQTDASAPTTPVTAPVAAPAPLPSISGTALTPDESAFIQAGAQEVLGAKGAQDAAALIAVAPAAEAAIAALPSGKWVGRLDLSKDFQLGGWQSLKSTDEAYGISKRVWHLDKGNQTLLNVGLFVGVDKPLVPLASSSPKFLGGATIAVPGSTLDWALGTKMGDAWAPNLKTGVLCAYDLSRIKQIGLVPDFVGIGASYKFALGSTAVAAK